jgi:hypothetical protein
MEAERNRLVRWLRIVPQNQNYHHQHFERMVLRFYGCEGALDFVEEAKLSDSPKTDLAA